MQAIINHFKSVRHHCWIQRPGVVAIEVEEWGQHLHVMYMYLQIPASSQGSKTGDYCSAVAHRTNLSCQCAANGEARKCSLIAQVLLPHLLKV